MKMFSMTCPLSVVSAVQSPSFRAGRSARHDLLSAAFLLSWQLSSLEEVGEILHDPCEVQTPEIAAGGIEIGWKLHTKEQYNNKCEEEYGHDFILHKILPYCRDLGWGVNQIISVLLCAIHSSYISFLLYLDLFFKLR